MQENAAGQQRGGKAPDPEMRRIKDPRIAEKAACVERQGQIVQAVRHKLGKTLLSGIRNYTPDCALGGAERYPRADRAGARQTRLAQSPLPTRRHALVWRTWSRPHQGITIRAGARRCLGSSKCGKPRAAAALGRADRKRLLIWVGIALI